MPNGKVLAEDNPGRSGQKSSPYPVKTPRSVVLEINMPGLALMVCKAIAPETRELPRASASVQASGDLLIIQISAEDTSALRAAVNSYLRWVGVAIETSRVAGAGH